jgi:hypothetical protein
VNYWSFCFLLWLSVPVNEDTAKPATMQQQGGLVWWRVQKGGNWKT